MPVWVFQTEGSDQNLLKYSGPDGGPDYRAAFTEDFFENMVIGVNKLYSVGMLLSSPVIVGHEIYVGSTDGYLYALM